MVLQKNSPIGRERKSLNAYAGPIANTGGSSAAFKAELPKRLTAIIGMQLLLRVCRGQNHNFIRLRRARNNALIYWLLIYIEKEIDK